jgi:HD superfamily phosphodiesterase
MSPERFASWVAAVTADRDASHDMAHFRRVEGLALDLLREDEGSYREDGVHGEEEDRESLVRITALAHDVLDHKYVPDIHLEERREDLVRALREHAHLSDAQVEKVMLASVNVSLSRELAGRLQVEALREAGASWLRDLVSDADKLDSLGEIGLRRLVDGHGEIFATPGMSSEDARKQLRVFTDKYLEHRPFFVRGRLARSRAEALMSETRQLLESESRWRDLLRGSSDKFLPPQG